MATHDCPWPHVTSFGQNWPRTGEKWTINDFLWPQNDQKLAAHAPEQVARVRERLHKIKAANKAEEDGK